LKTPVKLLAYMLLGIGISNTNLVNAAQVRIYNWSDYIGESTLKDFQTQTDISPLYDVFDSNETLEAKLLAGQSGYDVVVPSSHFLARQIKAGVFLKLDKEQIPNLSLLDKFLLKFTQNHDPNNEYSVPYLWGTNGIGYNVDKIKQVLGVDEIDSWQYLFEPEYMQKLASCGVAFLDSPDEMFPAILHYLGFNPNSTNVEDFKKAEAKFMQVRQYVTYFHSSKYITDLANGDICIAAGFSGDVMQAIISSKEAKNGVNIAYSVPKEGGALWFDVMAIPKDAPNVEAAHEFINFILEPQNIAEVTNYVGYANAVPAANKLVAQEIINNKNVYPSAKSFKNMYISNPLPNNIVKQMNRSWTKIKTNN